MEGTTGTPRASSGSSSGDESLQEAPAPLTEEQLIRIEFYKTYDVMTGVRIAATLGGFFSMMILLVLYKSYCKPSKSLSEEQLNRAVSAAVEEEDRALAAALEATSFYSSLGKQRQSIGSGSQPRYSSPGGRRSSAGTGPVFRASAKDCEALAESEDDEICDEVEQECATDYYGRSYLSVPVDRRASSITCSSGDSSYLERRGSAFEMGLPAPPSLSTINKRKAAANDESWDFYYPIDIQVIQPTPPGMSPSTSERTLYEEPKRFEARACLQVPDVQDRMHRLTVDRSAMGLAPLASISSLGSFSSQSSPWLSGVRREKREAKTENQEDSVGSDSVFVDEADTEDEAEDFETDSELENGFDDDYSFCEASRRPVSRCEHQPRYASFDSCDISLGEIPADEGQTVGRTGRRLGRQQSAQDGARTKRRLIKTYSEPRQARQLPVWLERGRSGYVPRRQLSSPAAAAAAAAARPKERTPPPPSPLSLTHAQRPQLALPCSGSESDSITLTQHDECLSQGTKTSVQSTEKRGRFVKQKTIRDEPVNPPAVIVAPSPCEEIDESSSRDTTVVVNIETASRSSSQETLC